MKFLLRILIYLAVTIVNFGIYVFLFLTLTGLSPERSIDLLKVKMEQIKVDTTDAALAQAGNNAMLSEVEKARKTVSSDMEELKLQKAQLLSEKTELEALREEIKRLMAAKSKADEDRMYSLAKIYDGMDQERLAAVFNQMDDSLIVSVLPKMKPANASLVLEFLPPQRSAVISQMLLGVR
jgi:flagellar motility protein MotE (MotC chaperone)